jgi:hypothetical protein
MVYPKKKEEKIHAKGHDRKKWTSVRMNKIMGT